MKSFTMLAALSVSLFACVGSAQIVSQNETGGTFALDGDQDKAMKDAHLKMAAHCSGRGYQIVGRQRAVVGTENYSNSQTDYDETKDRQRDSVNTGGAYSQSQSGYMDTASDDSTTSFHNDGYGDSHVHSSGGQVATGGAYQDSNSGYIDTQSEDETTVTQGGEQTSSVNGTRQVYENRISYRCN